MWNRYFSCLLKVCRVISGLRRAAGRLFHRAGYVLCSKPERKPTGSSSHVTSANTDVHINVVHNLAQNSSDNLHSYPSDNHHQSDVVKETTSPKHYILTTCKQHNSDVSLPVIIRQLDDTHNPVLTWYNAVYYNTAHDFAQF